MLAPLGLLPGDRRRSRDDGAHARRRARDVGLGDEDLGLGLPDDRDDGGAARPARDSRSRSCCATGPTTVYLPSGHCPQRSDEAAAKAAAPGARKREIAVYLPANGALPVGGRADGRGLGRVDRRVSGLSEGRTMEDPGRRPAAAAVRVRAAALRSRSPPRPRPSARSCRSTRTGASGAATPPAPSSGGSTTAPGGRSTSHTTGASRGPTTPAAPSAGAAATCRAASPGTGRRFALPAAERGRRIALEFDGVMADARVWVNGRHVGHRPERLRERPLRRHRLRALRRRRRRSERPRRSARTPPCSPRRAGTPARASIATPGWSPPTRPRGAVRALRHHARRIRRSGRPSGSRTTVANESAQRAGRSPCGCDRRDPAGAPSRASSAGAPIDAGGGRRVHSTRSRWRAPAQWDLDHPAPLPRERGRARGRTAVGRRPRRRSASATRASRPPRASG